MAFGYLHLVGALGRHMLCLKFHVYGILKEMYVIDLVSLLHCNALYVATKPNKIAQGHEAAVLVSGIRHKFGKLHGLYKELTFFLTTIQQFLFVLLSVLKYFLF